MDRMKSMASSMAAKASDASASMAAKASDAKAVAMEKAKKEAVSVIELYCFFLSMMSGVD